MDDVGRQHRTPEAGIHHSVGAWRASCAVLGDHLRQARIAAAGLVPVASTALIDGAAGTADPRTGCGFLMLELWHRG